MKAIKTGEGVSWIKAVGMLYPPEQRLFEDPFSEKLLSPFYKFWLILMRSPKIFKFLMQLREKSTPGLVGWMFCRFRYIDDVLKKCLAENEIDTVVNLGAGYDCRAFYIPGVQNIRYFEVDHPDVIRQKKAKMTKILGVLPKHVIFVPLDFEQQSLETEFANAGYSLSEKTLFIWEGVTQYITEEAVNHTLKYISQAASSSKLVFTYVLKSFIEGKIIHDGVKVMYKYMCKGKNPLWMYGMDPAGLTEYLAKYSLSLIEDIGSPEVKDRYMDQLNLNLKVFEIERLALAEVKN